MILKKKIPNFASIFTILLFVVIMVFVMVGTADVSQSAGHEGAQALRSAIERASILCYASEGFYPPSLAYIQDNYGVQIDTATYVVRYDVTASNLMPVIFVSVRS